MDLYLFYLINLYLQPELFGKIDKKYEEKTIRERTTTKSDKVINPVLTKKDHIFRKNICGLHLKSI